MIAMTAINGMMKPPRSSSADSVDSPARADTIGAEAAVCAITGALVMEAATNAATVAFLKLIVNSPSSWLRLDCHSGFALTTPICNRASARPEVLLFCTIDALVRILGHTWPLSGKSVNNR